VAWARGGGRGGAAPQGWGGSLQTSHRGGQGSIQGQSVWDLQ
jgi:hypothetical protein